MDRRQNRVLLEGAGYAFAMGILAALGLSVPWLFFISSLLLPIPLILMIYRYGLKKGLLTLALAYILVLLIYPDSFTAAIIFAHFGAVGLVFGLMFRNKVSAGTSLFSGVALAGLITLFAIMLIALAGNITYSSLETQFTNQFNESLKTYQQSYQISETEKQELQQSMQATTKFMTRLLPGIMVMGAMVSTMITFFIARGIMARWGHKILPMPSFSQWTYPWYTVWGMILALALTVAGDHYRWPTTAIIGKNLLYVFGFIFLLLGIAILTYHFRRLSWPRYIKWPLLIILILIPVTPYLLALAGALDPLLDLRRLNKENKQA